MASTTSKGTIATLAFAIPEGNDYQEIVELLHRLTTTVPSGWQVANLSVRDPQFGTEMIQRALTGVN